MTPLVFLLIALAGGIGAVARFVVDGLIRSRIRTAYPWATTVVNLSGSLALGFMTGLATAHVVSSNVFVVVGAGFLGGYTTLSTASFETVELIRAKRYALALASGVGMLVACIALAGAGLWLGSTV